MPRSNQCCAVVIFMLTTLTPLAALDKVVVGQGGMAWSDAMESSRFLNVSSDSIWIDTVERGQNLSPLILQRGGTIDAASVERHEFGGDTRTFLSNVQVARMLDGDESTAFNPDEAGVSREAEIYLDLGSTIGISRVRFFPRLDSKHRDLFLQAFELGFNSGANDVNIPLGLPDLFFSFFINAPRFKRNDRSIVTWPRVDEVVQSQQTRFVLIKPLVALPWEIAELELFSDGSAPTGVYTSRTLSALTRNPVWAQVRHPGEDISEFPVRIQTHTGPDAEPLHYFFHSGIDTELRKVSREVWEGFDDLPPGDRVTRRGPVLPNPAWTPWQTVTDGVIRSPAFKFFQFRVEIIEPGTALRSLFFEYTDRPLAQVLNAEITPSVAAAAEETDFVLSLGIRRVSDADLRESGFRLIQVDTPAEISRIDSVRVNDRTVLYKSRIERGEGFSIKLWERAIPGRGFIQVFFQGRVYVDGTKFDVRAQDVRSTDGVVDTVSQFASEGDVDVRSPGARLAVRLVSQDDSLIEVLPGFTPDVFSPNGDGINDVFALEIGLLRLTQAVPLQFQVFDLAGRLVHRTEDQATSGRSILTWDGRDEAGALVAPGQYVYRILVQADIGTASYQGLVGVAY